MPVIKSNSSQVGEYYYAHTAGPRSLYCDGSSCLIVQFPSLFLKTGYAYGGVVGTSFKLYDARGRAIRNPDGGIANDPDAASRTSLGSGTYTVASCVTTSGQATVTLPTFSGVAPGMTVSGTNVPGSTFVRAVSTDGLTITMGNSTDTANVNASGSGTVTLTFSIGSQAGYVGSVQSDQFFSHTHTTTGIATQGFSVSNGSGLTLMGGGNPASNGSTGGNETRMKNGYLKLFVRY